MSDLGDKPAFPEHDVKRTIDGVGHLGCSCPGLTKREWLVGQALAGRNDIACTAETIAGRAVMIADAALAELEKERE